MSRKFAAIVEIALLVIIVGGILLALAGAVTAVTGYIESGRMSDCARWAEINSDLDIGWDDELGCVVRNGGTWLPFPEEYGGTR